MSADPVCVSLCGRASHSQGEPGYGVSRSGLRQPLRSQPVDEQLREWLCQPIRSASASAVGSSIPTSWATSRVSRSGLRQPLRFSQLRDQPEKAKCQPIRSASASAVARRDAHGAPVDRVSADPVCVSLCGENPHLGKRYADLCQPIRSASASAVWRRDGASLSTRRCQPIRSASASAVRVPAGGLQHRQRVSRSGLRQPLRFGNVDLDGVILQCQPIRSASASAVLLHRDGEYLAESVSRSGLRQPLRLLICSAAARKSIVSADPVCVSLCGYPRSV